MQFNSFPAPSHLQTAGKRRSNWLILVLALLLSSAGLVLLLSTRAATAAPEQPVAGPSCAGTPFGGVLDLYMENEVFVAATSNHPDLAELSTITVDYDADQQLLLDIRNQESSSDTPAPPHAVAAADLDGDGYTEFIQTLSDSSGGYRLNRHNPDGSWQQLTLSSDQHGELAAAAGNLLGGDGETEQAALASVNQATGALTVAIWNNGVEAVWRSTMDGRAHADRVDIAVGNFNDNNKDDIALVFHDDDDAIQLIVLEYDPGHQSGVANTPDYAYRLAELDSWSVNAGMPMDVQVAAARLNDDLLQEIVIAYDLDLPDSELASDIRFEVLYLHDGKIQPQNSMDFTIPNSQSFNFALTAADLNGNFRQELIVAYDSSGGGMGSGLVLTALHGAGLSSPAPTLAMYDTLFTPWSVQRSQARFLSAAAGDIDGDGLAEIVTAQDDGRGLELLLFHSPTPGQLALGAAFDADITDLTTTTSLALGDLDNDSLKGFFNPAPGEPGDCRPVTERRITAVVYTPPYWEKMQLPENNRGTIGRGTTQSGSAETAYTFSRSHAVSGFVGLGVAGSYGLGSFESNIRFTAEQEFSQSQTSGSGVYTSTTMSVHTYDENPFVTFEESLYDCYGYELRQNGAPIADSSGMRSCLYVETLSGAAALPTWESTYGPRGAGSRANEALSWTPAVRDWANLALFREADVTQSSGDNAARAVDGDLSGIPAAMSATNLSDYPWWQVDLGESRPLTKVRIWGREDRSGCQDRTSCPAMLTDLYVFISDEPFNSDDPAVLRADPDVYHTSLADLSPALDTITAAFPLGRVTTLQTLDGSLLPVHGRYLRIQIDRPAAILSLAEVQLFGDGHVEPDRYPLAVRDPLPDDGYFQVQLHDPYESNLSAQFKWIDVRGNLLWQWEDGPINNLIGPGETTTEWALSEESGGSRLSAASQGSNTTLGVEFDLTAGVVAQVQLGGGTYFGRGVMQEHVFTTSWGEAFNMGGYVEGFPAEYNNSAWTQECRYRIRPYFYQLVDESTFGVETSFNVVDYTVPGSSPGDLQRGVAMLANCRNGNLVGNEPQTTPDSFTTPAAGPLLMSVIANDTGSNLQIVAVSEPGHGTVSFTNRTIRYTPEPGFIGQDSFTYRISDGDANSEGTVTVDVTARELFLPLIAGE